MAAVSLFVLGGIIVLSLMDSGIKLTRENWWEVFRIKLFHAMFVPSMFAVLTALVVLMRHWKTDSEQCLTLHEAAASLDSTPEQLSSVLAAQGNRTEIYGRRRFKVPPRRYLRN